MNQILSTENNYNKKKNTSKKSNSNLIDMKMVIVVFSVLILIFALVIVGAKIYGIMKEKKPSVELNRPSISIEETNNGCNIIIGYDEGVQKVIYWWNDEDVKESNLNGSTEPFQRALEIPEGEKNILHVKAIGIDGSMNEMQKEFVSQDMIQDMNKPVISWYHYSGTTKMDITVKSQKGIKDLSYTWEGEEPTVVEATSENQRELKITIDVKRGTNKLYIKATDVEGNEGEKDGNIMGVLAPTIDFYIENDTLKFKIAHDMGFKKVIIKINQQEFIYDETNPQYSSSTKELFINNEIQPGSLDVEVIVYTLEEPEKEYKEQGHADIPG